MKIGVVGSGVAGLIAAWLFSRAGHQVVVFEKSEHLGFDGAGVKSQDFPCEIDVPLRLFNPGHWSSLSRLYHELGIDTESIVLSQSYSDDDKTYLRVDLQSVFGAEFSALFNTKARNIIQQARRLKSIGLQDIRTLSKELSLADYLFQRGFDSNFTDDFLYPMLSTTVCTCSVAALKRYPARYVLQILANITPNDHRSNSLLRAQRGTREVQRMLVAGIDEIRTGTAVVQISREQKVTVVSHCQAGQRVEEFDHVIIATQANHAGRLLKQPSDVESQMLSSFEYEPVKVAVHRDESFMPQKSCDWTAFNFAKERSDDASEPMCTIWLNRFARQFELDQNVFQTINPIRQPKSGSVLAERILSRPVVNHSSGAGWRLLDTIHSESCRNTWFVGSYACAGIPLLETAVESVIKIARRLDVDVSVFADQSEASVTAAADG